MWEKIADIIQKAHSAGGRDAMTEEKTKQFLIEPILTELGWDLANPKEVQREYKNVVDYALFGQRTTIFLEAKRLGAHLDSAMQQVLQYAIQKDIRPDFVITTDGVHWNCVSMRYQALIFSINLQELDEAQRAKFTLLGKPSVDAGALTNYANQIRTEQEVLAYLKRNAQAIATDIHAYDSIFNEKAIIDYIDHLANQTSIVIRVTEPRAPRPDWRQKEVNTASTSSSTPPPRSIPSKSYPPTSWAETYDIGELDRNYLMLVAQRLADMEKQVGEKLFVRFGITGNWSTPNYQVETASGKQTWTFRGRGRLQKPFGAKFFNPNKITAKRYSLEDIQKVLE